MDEPHDTVTIFAKKNQATGVEKIPKRELKALQDAGRLTKGAFVTQAGGEHEPYWPQQVFGLTDDRRVVWCMAFKMMEDK